MAANSDREFRNTPARLPVVITGRGIHPPGHQHIPRRAFVAIMLDAGVDLGGIQIAACHADACTTMRHDRVG
jgi:site-specific recombinase XerD